MLSQEPVLIVRPPPSPWPDRVRLDLGFDPAPLAAEVARLDEAAWIAHFVRQNYEGDWSALALRSGAKARHPCQTIYSDPTESDWVDTPLLDAMPAFRAVLAAFHCPLTAVRLMRLTPGSRIKPHEDHDLSLEYGLARIHVPVITGPDVDFRLNGNRVEMEPGSAWYLRLADTHSVVNRGVQVRIHLVIDAKVNAWLLERVERGMKAAGMPPDS